MIFVPTCPKYTRYTGPKSMRNSETPAPTGLQSPRFPNLSRSILTLILARALMSLRALSHSENGVFPLGKTYSSTCLGCAFTV
jgi:hypothetical protein